METREQDEIKELWKSVAINAANNVELPHLVANYVVEEYKKQFNLNQ